MKNGRNNDEDAEEMTNEEDDDNMARKTAIKIK